MENSDSERSRVMPHLEARRSRQRLLRTRSTFSKSVMVSVAVSILGTTELMFIEPGVTRCSAIAERPLVLAERGRLELAVRFNSLSYVHIVGYTQYKIQ